MNGRPIFETPDAYVDDCRRAIMSGRLPWEPATRRELVAALDYFGGTGQDHLFRPTASAMRLIGLPPDYGRTSEPFSERFKGRLLETMDNDADFAQAVRLLTGMETA